MLPAFDKLSRMLIQEKRLKYENKTVFGGFEKLAPNWATEALQEATSEAERLVIEEVQMELTQYCQISAEDRPNYLHQILVKLHKVERTAREIRQEQKSPSPPPQTEKPSLPKSPPPTPSPKPKPQPKSKPKPKPVDNRLFADTGLDSPVTKLPGIKDGMARKLANLDIYQVGDFLYHFPRRYDDYRSLKPIHRLEYGEEVTIIAQVWETRKRETRNRKTLVTSTLSDGTSTIEATWFNQPWLVNKLRPGVQIVISGKVDSYRGRLTFQSPEWEELDKEMVHTGRIVPVYPLTQGLTIKWLRRRIKQAVDYWAGRLTDPLPADDRERLGLPPLGEAIRQIHFPLDWDKLETARRRLAFDELLLIQLGVIQQRQLWQAQQGQPITVEADRLERLIQSLPFELTQAQRRVINEITADLRRETSMSRLLQGDVGSGKTVVALLAMALTGLDNGQSAMLAPTEILAEQHFQSINRLAGLLEPVLERPLRVRLLTGSVSAGDRKEILAALQAGEVDILVGTHAIIQGDVGFRNLRLAVVDEQHRFGVRQRGLLREKGFNPHMLVMTATPIPRTLAMTLYGDLDLSIIDEMPPGRQEVKTRWLFPRERERAYVFIRSQIEQGRQAFIICPLVEESDKSEARSAMEEHKRLQKEVFPRLKLGLLHGRMKAGEKEKVMRRFRDGEIHILVSTSVVEVGIDVPNATTILIEGANRFGLAQLHQFRGRVGRGEEQSYCLLLADSVTPEAKSRLKAVEGTTNGFELAEQDLKMRGPGEFFGTRQSGLPDLKLVKLSDIKLLEMARQEARLIFEKDPGLEQSRHRLLAEQLQQFWHTESDPS